jgi:hypothetical protein
MTSSVIAARPKARAPGGLRLATCGHHTKYAGGQHYRWTDYAIAALREPGAELTHIGEVPDDQQVEIRGALAAAGIDPARYVFAGQKPSLPQALIDSGADIYLSSYPASGGKANLEAMLIDLPVIVPMEKDMPPMLRFDLPLPRFLTLDEPDQLAAVIPRALSMGEAFRTPEQLAIRERELGRFADFVAGRPLAPA